MTSTVHREQRQRDYLKAMDLARVDTAVYLFGFAKTQDEDDPEHPVKPFPVEPYLRHMLALWQAYQRMAVAKSRQMRVTWFFVSVYTWDAGYHYGRRGFFQSIRADDSDLLLDRAVFQLKHLPKELRPRFEKTKCRLRFPEMNSVIHAVSESAEAIVSKTASWIFSDETSIQPFAEAAYAASNPALGRTGRYAGVGTPRGQNFFYRLWADRLNEGSDIGEDTGLRVAHQSE